ncbi:efflux RND transporter periplasmic adaptor subunit [Paenibacillus sp. J5C_2022]|uniref:efflux RND transporter periplasmic adaptor subunit n=1 Tax=Paenibacillus sp. J5C2022 TaxID=2977129 RepID=UPI0021CE2861|nr:efflux RND transporter periplasmic adaptor subunit [Paenibacillus sp. J5C2022]MCU6709437.1 efflux RND transporter periplasmic adaptor subunit [Paenibacillus sp. J5C2022]
MSMKWWTGSLYKRSLIAVMSVSLVFASGCSLLPSEKEEEQIPDITPPKISQKPEYEVKTKTLETKVQVIGKLISMEEETLYFTKDARLKELYVKSGDKVKTGDLIGELDVSDLEKSLRLERIAFQREENAMKENLRKRDEMEPMAFEELRISFEEKRQQLVDKQEEIDKATLYAPFDGTIVSLSVQKGDSIKAYDPVAIVADTSLITPAAKLTKTELEKVAPGMEVLVSISGVGAFDGKVKQLPVKSTENDNNNGFPNPNNNNKPERPEDFMIVNIPKLPKDLNRGTPVSIHVITKRTENAIVIPPTALRNIGSRTYVQVIDKEGNKAEVDVEVGQQTATDVEILQGLKPGQKVVGR